MSTKHTNNEFESDRDDFTDRNQSHVKYRVTDNHFYSVTGAAGLSFCSEGMAR